jgi:hypothetical protein
MGNHMHAVQVVTLLLALSGALNVAFVAGIIARHADAAPAQAILTAAGAAGTLMAIFFTAVSAYH